MKKNNKTRKLLAIVGIIILVGLYVMAFVFALTENPNSMRMFAVSIVATVIIPVCIYVINMFLKLGQDKREFSEEIAAGKFVPDLPDEKLIDDKTSETDN